MNSSKNQRILYIFDRLNKNKVIKISDLAQEFNVSKKSIQRDILNIKDFLSYTDTQVKYSYSSKGYYLEKNGILTDSQVYALLKILLDSRAFNKDELEQIITSILGASSLNEYKKITQLISNERVYFKQLEHGKNIINKIWDIANIVQSKDIININYKRADNTVVKRTIAPVGILFSEYYFYVMAYFENIKFDSPTIFRIDRIEKYEKVGRKNSIKYNERFEEGDFRKRIHFMYGGNLINVEFEFYGKDIDSIQDRIPTATYEKVDDKYIINANVYEDGIVKWILSQGKLIKVTKPDSLIRKIKNELNEINKFYCK